MKVVWTRPALRDLEGIGDYLARNNPKAASKIVAHIADQADLLAEFPHVGRTGRIVGTRELVVKDSPFIVVHRVKEDRVEVLAVFHGARRWPNRFE